MAFCLENMKKEYDGGARAFFTSDRNCIEYLLEVNLAPLEEFALLVTEGSAWVFAPFDLEKEEAETICYDGYSNITYQDKKRNIRKKLDEIQLPVQIESGFEALPLSYGEYFKKRGCVLTDVGAEIEKKALVKTQRQIEAVRFCVDLNEKAYMKLMGRCTAEATEVSLFRYIQESNRSISGYQNEMIYDFLAGRKTAEVSGQPTDYRLKKEDTLIADLLPRHNGVYADMTRTYFIGKATDKQQYTYDILLEALEEAEKLLKPGAGAWEVYACVKNIFFRHGLDGNFPHHAGHGLGMGYYEPPYFLKEEEMVLEENMIVALEPGLYYPNEFGIRIENNYLITKEGAKRLGSLGLDMEDYILPYM